jgi:hypothetical protein
LPVAEAEGQLFKIGEVIKKSGFTRQQIHNFLTMGLIKEESRTAGGHRLFGAEVFRRLSIIRGLLAQDYPLAEIRRTWKAFLRLVLICFLLGGLAAPVRPAARAGEGAAAVSKEDLGAIRELFERLRRMMIDGDAGALASMLAPSVGNQQLHEMVESAEAEFESRSYTDFRCEFDEKKDLEVLAPDRVRVSVLIRYRYYLRSESAVPQGDDDGQFWDFELVRTSGQWRMAEAPFFKTFYPSQDEIFGKIFLYAAIIFIVGSFWGWMFLDCCFRHWGGRKLPWVLAVGLLPGAGALVYFFAIWMRQGPED